MKERVCVDEGVYWRSRHTVLALGNNTVAGDVTEMSGRSAAAIAVFFYYYR